MSSTTTQPGDSAKGSAGGKGRAKLTSIEFAQRLEESHRTVWTIAASILNDPTAAEDMVQEAAAVGLTKLHEFDPASSFAAWFGQIVRFVSLNESRKQKRVRGQGDGSLEGVAAGESATGGGLDARVIAAMASLPEVARTCLLMRTLHGMTFAQIASALDIPEGTAMSHVHRARAHLRERLASMAPTGKGGAA